MARTGSISLFLGVVAAVLAASAPGFAAGDARAGRALVDRLCAGCHAVAAGQTGRHSEAPGFVEVVRRYPPEHLAEALAEGIMVAHQPIRMPEFSFTPAEIDDILAYLEALRRSAGAR
jgi:cytochrome c